MAGGTALHWQVRAVAMAAAEAGGRSALRHFRRSGLAVEWKSDESPVTIADREAESACKDVIAQAFPEDGWLGEETGEHSSESGRQWIVDPIDGTRNFVRGIPLWSTLVACEETDATGVRRVVASAVSIPALQETYDAVRGGGARCNGIPIAVSAIQRMSEALFCYETPAWFIDNGLGPVFEALCRGSGLQRGGGDAFYHMLVASGRAEIVVEPRLAVWDVAATSLIVEEAGGRFSDLRGKHDIRANDAVITNGLLHAETISLITALRSQSHPQGR